MNHLDRLATQTRHLTAIATRLASDIALLPYVGELEETLRIAALKRGCRR